MLGVGEDGLVPARYELQVGPPRDGRRRRLRLLGRGGRGWADVGCVLGRASSGGGSTAGQRTRPGCHHRGAVGAAMGAQVSWPAVMWTMRPRTAVSPNSRRAWRLATLSARMSHAERSGPRAATPTKRVLQRKRRRPRLGAPHAAGAPGPEAGRPRAGVAGACRPGPRYPQCA